MEPKKMGSIVRLTSNRALAAIAVCLLGAAGARAQGSRFDNIAFGASGKPVAAATVAVCTATASTSTTPCSPLATIYTDATLTVPATNPFSGDGLGNFGFWAPPGKYQVQIYGSGIVPRVMTAVLPCDPTNNCTVTGTTTFSNTVSANTLNLSGNLAVTGTGTVTGRNIASEGLPSDETCWVSPNGNNANTGFNIGAAKADVYSCVQAISAVNANGAQGIVYVNDPVSAGGPLTYQGVWLMTSFDPHYNNAISTASCTAGVVTLSYTAAHNYATGVVPVGSPDNITVSGVSGGSGFNGNFQIASVPTSTTLTYTSASCSGSGTGGASLPEGWVKVSGNGIRIVGVGCSTSISSGTGGPVCTISGGASGPNIANATTYPALWLSGVSQSTFDHVRFTACVAMKLNIDSNGQINGNLAASSNRFVNDVFQAVPNDPTLGTAGCGPAVLTGDNALWQYFDHDVFNASGNTTISITTLSRSANVVTAVTSGTNYFLNGELVYVTGSTGGTLGFNGYFTITSVSGATNQTITWAQVGPTESPTTNGSLAEAADNDNRAAVLACGSNGSVTPCSSNVVTLSSLAGGATQNGFGPAYFRENNSNGGGGLRWRLNCCSNIVQVEHFLEEGKANSQPIVEFKDIPGSVTAVLMDLDLSDTGDSPPLVKVNPGIPAEEISVIDTFGEPINVDGPATVFNTQTSGNSFQGSYAGTPVPNVSAAAKGQRGVFLGRSLNVVDAHRREFAASLVRFQNLASQQPSAWTAVQGTGVTITPCAGLDPQNTVTQAGCLTSTSDVSGYSGVAVSSQVNTTLTLGEYIFASVWVQAASGTGMQQTALTSAPLAIFSRFGGPTLQPISCTGCSLAPNQTTGYAAPYAQNDGNWQYIYFLARVTGGTLTGVNTSIQLNFQAAKPMNFYAPVLYLIPASSVSIINCTIAASPTGSVEDAAGATATITTSAACGLNSTQVITNVTTPQVVLLQGIGAAGFNGVFTVKSVTDTTHFIVPNTIVAANTTSGGGNVYMLNDSEMADFALNSAPVADDLLPSSGPSGTSLIALLRGQVFGFGGTGNFHGILSQGNTANRTYTFPDAAGNVVVDSATQTLTNKTYTSPTFGGHTGRTSANGDASGQLTVSSSTSATLIFGTAYASAPVCTVSPTSNPGSATWWVTTTTTTMALNLSASGTITFNYACVGNPN